MIARIPMPNLWWLKPIVVGKALPAGSHAVKWDGYFLGGFFNKPESVLFQRKDFRMSWNFLVEVVVPALLAPLVLSNLVIDCGGRGRV